MHASWRDVMAIALIAACVVAYHWLTLVYQH